MAAALPSAKEQIALIRALIAAPPVQPEQRDLLLQRTKACLDHFDQTNLEHLRSSILEHIVPNASRLEAFAAYLVVKAVDVDAGRSVSARCVTALDVLNEVMHHNAYESATPQEHFNGMLTDHVTTLVRHARKSPDQAAALADLLSVFMEQGYFSSSTIERLKTSPPHGEPSDEATHRLLPEVYGIPGAQWYVQPAALMLSDEHYRLYEPIDHRICAPLRFKDRTMSPHIMETTKRLKEYGKKLKFGPVRFEAPATDPHLDPDQRFHDLQGTIANLGIDYDAFGQKNAKKDPHPRNYYGWSLDFCAKMREEKKAGIPAHIERTLGQSSSDLEMVPPRQPPAQARSQQDRGFGRLHAPGESGMQGPPFQEPHSGRGYRGGGGSGASQWRGRGRGRGARH